MKVTFLIIGTGCLVVSVLTAAEPALAADGDVVLMRQVQPRAATRPPVVPDPNPRVVNAKPSSYVGDELQMRQQAMELNDSEFSAITSGTRMPQQLLAPLTADRHSSPAAGSSVAGHNPVGHSGNALGKVDGQINRSIQQGLQPLQSLQRQ